MKVVITYKNADLDCVASAYAYSEYLNKKGENTNYFISGVVQNEVEVVCNMFGIELTSGVKSINGEPVIVVDTNTFSSIDFVNPEQIIEIIDHHPRSTDVFENATIDIEQIGAVCTMITEKYKKDNISISRESAILLYYGIISNTVNLNSKVTTPRDIEMCNWLKEQCTEIDDNLIAKIFEEKSKFDIRDLRRMMEVEEKFVLGDEELIIGQLEIINAENFLKQYKSNIDSVINDVRNQYGVSLVFLNIIDILSGYHIIYSPYRDTISFLEEKYQSQFDDDRFVENRIVLRKEIKQYLRDTLKYPKAK